MARQRRNVLGALPQGRHVDLHDVHPEEKILPERTLIHHLAQVPMGRQQDPSLERDTFAAPQPAKFLLL
jgi:hypothetical protein